MRAHQIDESGLIFNTIEVESLDFMPSLVDAEIGGSIGDCIVDGTVVYKPAPAASAPMSVTKKQARLALHRAGHFDAVQQTIDSLPEPERTEAQIQWDDSLTYERADPFVAMLGAMIGLEDAELDTLFIAAGTL